MEVTVVSRQHAFNSILTTPLPPQPESTPRKQKEARPLSRHQDRPVASPAVGALPIDMRTLSLQTGEG